MVRKSPFSQGDPFLESNYLHELGIRQGMGLHSLHYIEVLHESPAESRLSHASLTRPYCARLVGPDTVFGHWDPTLEARLEGWSVTSAVKVCKLNKLNNFGW